MKKPMVFVKSIRILLKNWWIKLKSNGSNNNKHMSKFPGNLTQDIINLNTTLIKELQEAHGQFCTRTRYAVSIQDLTERKRIQADLDHGVGLFCAAHVMAIFEKSIPFKYWDDLFEPEDFLRLIALRHIRRCAANGFTGDRVSEDTAQFNEVMTSNKPLRGIESYDEDHIRLTERIGIEALPLLQDLANKALIKVHRSE